MVVTLTMGGPGSHMVPDPIVRGRRTQRPVFMSQWHRAAALLLAPWKAAHNRKFPELLQEVAGTQGKYVPGGGGTSEGLVTTCLLL